MLQRIINAISSMNHLNVERAYKTMDAAVNQLRRANDEASDSAPEMDETVAEAIDDAQRFLAHKGEKSWDGLFREMHEYLTKIYMELGDYEKAQEQARFVLEYDRHEGEYLEKQIEAHKRGERLEDFDPSSVDESEED